MFSKYTSVKGRIEYQLARVGIRGSFVFGGGNILSISIALILREKKELLDLRSWLPM